MSFKPENDAKVRAEEAKTHRHLQPGEAVRNGDVYGGKDWGFLFTIGSKQVISPCDGDKCDALLRYRIRRPL